MLGERGAGRLAKTGDDVDDAVRESGFLNEFAETQRRKRRLFGGLEHDRAARRQRRRELPGRHHQREVPGDDLADDADRLAQGIGVPVARARNRDRLAVQARRPSRHVAEHVDRALHVVAARIGDRLAVVERFEFGEFVGMLFEQVAQPPDQARSLGRRDARPRTGLESPARGGDGQVDIGFVAGRDVGDDLFASPGLRPRRSCRSCASTHLPSMRSLCFLARYLVAAEPSDGLRMAIVMGTLPEFRG